MRVECKKRVERKVLKWFGHAERMGEDIMMKRMCIEGNRGREGP